MVGALPVVAQGSGILSPVPAFRGDNTVLQETVLKGDNNATEANANWEDSVPILRSMVALDFRNKCSRHSEIDRDH